MQNFRRPDYNRVKRYRPKPFLQAVKTAENSFSAVLEAQRNTIIYHRASILKKLN